jgi:hypothetical protein
LGGDFGANRLVARGFPAREHLRKMWPKKRVRVIAQRIEPEPIEAAGFSFFKQLAVADMSE